MLDLSPLVKQEHTGNHRIVQAWWELRKSVAQSPPQRLVNPVLKPSCSERDLKASKEGDRARSLAEDKVSDSQHSAHPEILPFLSQKAISYGGQTCADLITSSFVYTEMCSRRNHLHGFPRDWGEDDQSVVPCIVSSTFLWSCGQHLLLILVENSRMLRLLSQVILVKY